MSISIIVWLDFKNTNNRWNQTEFEKKNHPKIIGLIRFLDFFLQFGFETLMFSRTNLIS